jgi:hypothetical protein
MRSWLCTAVLAAALASAAPAQSAFDQRIAHWRVSGAAASCIAFNRPAYELNGSPFNALSVSLNKQERWNFMGFFFTSFVRPKVKTSGMPASGVKGCGRIPGDPDEHRPALSRRRCSGARRPDGSPSRRRGSTGFLRRHRCRSGLRGTQGLCEDPALAESMHLCAAWRGRRIEQADDGVLSLLYFGRRPNRRAVLDQIMDQSPNRHPTFCKGL